DYQAGNLDLGYPPSMASAALVTQSKPLENLIYLGLNRNSKPLDHLELRQALALAINKRSLAMNTLDGQATATNNLVPEGVPGYNPSLVGPDQTQAVTGNITKAVNLAHAFASSACGDQFADCPELTLEVASEDSAGQALATVIAQMWQAVAPGYPLQTRLE